MFWLGGGSEYGVALVFPDGRTAGARHAGEVDLRRFVEMEDGFAIRFYVMSAVGVEKLVGNVGQDGGAAGADATFGDENEEASEELADVNGGGEIRELGKEVGGEVFEVILGRHG